MPGDFVGHKIPIEPYESPDPALYELLKEVHYEIMSLAIKYFPNALIIPALGNNDYKIHYYSPPDNNKTEYYSYMFK